MFLLWFGYFFLGVLRPVSIKYFSPYYPCHTDGSLNTLTTSSAEGVKKPRKRCPVPDTKSHLFIKLQFLRSGVYGVLLLCHYSQVNSNPEPECLYLLGYHLFFKLISLKIIHIRWKSYNCIKKCLWNKRTKNGNIIVQLTRFPDLYRVPEQNLEYSNIMINNSITKK